MLNMQVLASDKEIDDSRELQGQSPYLINLGFLLIIVHIIMLWLGFTLWFS